MLAVPRGLPSRKPERPGDAYLQASTGPAGARSALRSATLEALVETPQTRPHGFSDAGFVGRLQAGDRDAMAAVVSAYLPQIHRAARGAGLAAERAEDVVQETFKTFVESAGRFEGRSHVRTWLFGILYRKIAEAWRGLGREREFDDVDEVFESRFDERGGWSRPPRPADRELGAKETRLQIAECLETAPARQRLAFVLREVEGLETPEICRILEVSRTNLGVMLHRLRNRVRECLETKGVTGAA